MDVRAVERCLLFLNGHYWGVYTIREKPDDHDYIDYTYKQDKYDIQFLKTWGQSWAEYGGEQSFKDWEKLRKFILENDMNIKNNYEKVKEQFDVLSLMDYMIANLSAVSSDWLNYNTGWWRGLDKDGSHQKWAYIMWDNDATFDYYINYSGVPNTNTDARACDIEDISNYMDDFFPLDTTLIEYEADSFFIDGEWFYYPGDTFYIFPDPGKHEKIFLKLLDESTEFRNQYFARYADMINTTFSCENMIHKLDSLIAILEPEMPRQIDRWGGSMNEWAKNIIALKKFVTKRCTEISEGLVDCYEVTGPHAITLITDPPGAGTIKFNTIDHATFPWTGEYFGNMDNTIEVTENNSKKFVKWHSLNGSTTFKNHLDKNTIAGLFEDDTLIAIFEGSTSTNDNEEGNIVVYPNPASDYINISSSNLSTLVSCTIKTIDGINLLTVSKMDKNQRIGIGQLPTGVYTLEIKTDNDLIVKNWLSPNRLSTTLMKMEDLFI